jgi:hypothetical protein
LSNLEQAHDDQVSLILKEICFHKLEIWINKHTDGNDSDCSIDNCDVCRQLRSAMNSEKRRSISNEDLYHSRRVAFETKVFK